MQARLASSLCGLSTRIGSKRANGFLVAGVDPHSSDTQMPWLEAIVALKLTAGEHALEFSSKHLAGGLP